VASGGWRVISLGAAVTSQNRFTNYEEWYKTLPAYLLNNPLMELKVYPKTLFLYDLVWFDCEILKKDVRGRALTYQLIQSAGSISANIEEGYGRGFGNDYARFLTIALGSARETQGRYGRARHLLSDKVVEHRIKLLDEIIGVLVTIRKQQKRAPKSARSQQK
jgi:four helix bundle protein